MSEIATLASVQEKVKEKIQQTFAELIPESMWQGLVATEIKKFVDVELPKVVKAEAEKSVIELLKTEFGKSEWNEIWSPVGMQASPMVKEIIKQAAPELVANLFGAVVQNMVNNLRNNPVRLY